LDLSNEKFTNILGAGDNESLTISVGPCSGKSCFSKSKIKSMLKKNPISIGIITGENQVDFNDYDETLKTSLRFPFASGINIDQDVQK
jgi:hypothetical protein